MQVQSSKQTDGILLRSEIASALPNLSVSVRYGDQGTVVEGDFDQTVATQIQGIIQSHPNQTIVLPVLKERLGLENSNQASQRLNNLAIDRSQREISAFAPKKYEAEAYNASNTDPTARDLSLAPILCQEARAKWKATHNGASPSDAELRTTVQPIVDFIVGQASPGYEQALGQILGVRSAIWEEIEALPDVASAQAYDVAARWTTLEALV